MNKSSMKRTSRTQCGTRGVVELVPPLIALVLWDLDSQEARRNQVQSTSERSRAAWLDFGGDRREHQGNRVKKTRKRALLLRQVPFPSSCAGACVLVSCGRRGGRVLDAWTAGFLKPKEKEKA